MSGPSFAEQASAVLEDSIDGEQRDTARWNVGLLVGLLVIVRPER